MLEVPGVLLADLEDARRAKVSRGLKNIDQQTSFIKLTDLSATELNRIRGVAIGAFDGLRALSAAGQRQIAAPRGGGGGGGGGAGGSFPPSGGGGGGGNERLQAALKRRRM